MSPMLEIKNLNVAFTTPRGDVDAVRDVSIDVMSGEMHAVIGQTGSGKSVLALSLLKLLPENACVSGVASFSGVDLISCPEKELRRIRGRQLNMIFQNPSTALNPVLSIEEQLCEIPMHIEGVSLGESRKRALETLELCGFRSPEIIMKRKPFELSGGMLQRVLIAMGIICRPGFLIADEPFKGLDVVLQKQVAETLYSVCSELEITLMMITHNLKVAEMLCDTVSVMYEGRIVETRSTKELFENPHHEYSSAMIGAYRALHL